MKHLILAAALVAATCSTSFAFDRPEKAQNDAAMQQGRKNLAAKTTAFETDIKRQNFSAAESEAMDLLALMRQGVGQTRADSDMMPFGSAQQKAQYNHMLSMEQLVHDYMTVMNDVKANGPKMSNIAHSFIKTY